MWSSHGLKHGSTLSLLMTDSCRKKVLLWNFSADQSLFALVFQQGDFCVCVFVVCVNCCLLSSQQLYVGLCVLCFGAHRPVNMSVSMCVNGLSPLALAMRVYTRWHPLTYCSICAHPGDTLSSPPPCVYHADTQYSRPPVCTICRGEPCFYLSPWRPGMSSFLLHFL